MYTVIPLLHGKRTKYLIVLLGRDTQVQSILTTAFEPGRRERRERPCLGQAV